MTAASPASHAKPLSVGSYSADHGQQFVASTHPAHVPLAALANMNFTWSSNDRDAKSARSSPSKSHTREAGTDPLHLGDAHLAATQLMADALDTAP
jgi:hypothetical protein